MLPTNTSDLEIIYSEIDEEDVSEDDGTYQCQSGLNEYLIHQFKFVSPNKQKSITVLVNLKTSLEPTISTVYLQVYNVSNTTWETIDSDSTSAPDTDFNLTAEITNNVSNYYDTDRIVTFRVYQYNTESSL